MLSFLQRSCGHGNFGQGVGALGDLSDKSDFSLLAWDSFSQEIRDLFTVVRSYYLYSIVKTLWIYFKCSNFLPKKEEMCYFFYRKERKTEQKKKKKIKIWEKFKKRPKRNLTIFRKEKNWVWHYWKVTAIQSAWILM